MSERRYYLTECDEGFFRWDKAITEAELKGRISSIIVNRVYDTDWNIDKAIDILLHGSQEQSCLDADTATYQELRKKEKPEEPIIISRACPPTCKGIQPKVHDVEEFYKEPDSWEAWVEKTPNPVFDFEEGTGVNWTQWCNRMRQHFREMPIRGKG